MFLGAAFSVFTIVCLPSVRTRVYVFVVGPCCKLTHLLLCFFVLPSSVPFLQCRLRLINDFGFFPPPHLSQVHRRVFHFPDRQAAADGPFQKIRKKVVKTKRNPQREQERKNEAGKKHTQDDFQEGGIDEEKLLSLRMQLDIVFFPYFFVVSFSRVCSTHHLQLSLRKDYLNLLQQQQHLFWYTPALSFLFIKFCFLRLHTSLIRQASQLVEQHTSTSSSSGDAIRKTRNDGSRESLNKPVCVYGLSCLTVSSILLILLPSTSSFPPSYAHESSRSLTFFHCWVHTSQQRDLVQ